MGKAFLAIIEFNRFNELLDFQYLLFLTGSCFNGHHLKDDRELFYGYFHCRMKLQFAHACVLYLIVFLCAFAGPVNKNLYQHLLVQNKAATVYYVFADWGLANRLTWLRSKPEHWTWCSVASWQAGQGGGGGGGAIAPQLALKRGRQNDNRGAPAANQITRNVFNEDVV